MSTNWRSSNPEAMIAHPLIAAEITWHRETSQLEPEIKRLQSKVGLMAKRYHSAAREINNMVTRLRAEPAPPVPTRGPPEEDQGEGEEEDEEGEEKEEDKEDKDTTMEDRTAPEEPPTTPTTRVATPPPPPTPSPPPPKTLVRCYGPPPFTKK
ncbi:hypothetical protein Q9L58_010480, partial [Maublancomyces gigas]